jgi:hypothetical protein
MAALPDYMDIVHLPRRPSQELPCELADLVALVKDARIISSRIPAQFSGKYGWEASTIASGDR